VSGRLVFEHHVSRCSAASETAAARLADCAGAHGSHFRAVYRSNNILVMCIEYTTGPRGVVSADLLDL
jgi:hypothetical protein